MLTEHDFETLTEILNDGLEANRRASAFPMLFQVRDRPYHAEGGPEEIHINVLMFVKAEVQPDGDVSLCLNGVPRDILLTGEEWARLLRFMATFVKVVDLDD